MDCCQLEDNVSGVKREDATGNDPENGSPDADKGGNIKYYSYCELIFIFLISIEKSTLHKIFF